MNSEIMESTAMHDAELQSVDQDGGALRLTFINVLPSVDDEVYYTVTVELSGINGLIRNDLPIRAVTLEGEGSSVLNFKRDLGKAVLVVNWQYYSEKRSELAVYEMFFENFGLTFAVQDDFVN